MRDSWIGDLEQKGMLCGVTGKWIPSHQVLSRRARLPRPCTPATFMGNYDHPARGSGTDVPADVCVGGTFAPDIRSAWKRRTFPPSTALLSISVENSPAQITS